MANVFLQVCFVFSNINFYLEYLLKNSIVLNYERLENFKFSFTNFKIKHISGLLLQKLMKLFKEIILKLK